MSYKFNSFETKTSTYYTHDYTTQDIEQYVLTYTAPALHGEGRYDHIYRFDTIEDFNMKLASIMQLVAKYELPLGNGKAHLFGAYILDGTILRTLVDIW